MSASLSDLITIGAAVSYAITGAGVYRYQYVKTYKAFRRWQAEDPEAEAQVYYDYHCGDMPRKKFTYYTYMEHVSLSVAPGWLSFFWGPIGLYFLGKKFLRPKIDMPDYTKIKKLERDLDELA